MHKYKVKKSGHTVGSEIVINTFEAYCRKWARGMSYLQIEVTTFMDGPIHISSRHMTKYLVLAQMDEGHYYMTLLANY